MRDVLVGVSWFLLMLALVVIMLRGPAHADDATLVKCGPLDVPCGEGEPCPAIEVPLGTLDVPADDDVLRVIIPSRRGRWGRPLNAVNIAWHITFTARFADFPDYRPDDDDAPTLRGAK